MAFSLATWNVKDFFDATDDPSTQDDTPTQATVDQKLKALGSAIRALSADVIALQEVENVAVLEQLNQTQLSQLNYKYVRLTEGNDIRGIDVALLSRFEVSQYISHSKDTFPGIQDPSKNYGFSRDCVEATLKLGKGRVLKLLINHLRSGTDNESILRREAQASRVQQLAGAILKSDPAANLAVLGDMNDTPETDTIKYLKGQAPALFDVLTLLSAQQRLTYKKQKQLDYVLLAPGLESDLDKTSVNVPYDALFSSTSDHYPIRVKLTLQ